MLQDWVERRKRKVRAPAARRHPMSGVARAPCAATSSRRCAPQPTQVKKDGWSKMPRFSGGPKTETIVGSMALAGIKKIEKVDEDMRRILTKCIAQSVDLQQLNVVLQVRNKSEKRPIKGGGVWLDFKIHALADDEPPPGSPRRARPAVSVDGTPSTDAGDDTRLPGSCARALQACAPTERARERQREGEAEVPHVDSCSLRKPPQTRSLSSLAAVVPHA